MPQKGVPMAKEKPVKLKVYQIFFDQVSKGKLDPNWLPYDNTGKLTKFFENSVIADLIKTGKHKNCDYFAVFSASVKDKVYFREEGLHFSDPALKKILGDNRHVDVFSFFKRRKQENIIFQAGNYHPGFVEKMEFILGELDIKLPNKLDKVVLFNMMVMRPKIWAHYCRELLFPAMKIMESMPELDQDSRYHHLGKKKDYMREEFTKAFGYSHYPFHPFICERLPSVFFQMHPEYTFKHIF